MAYDISWVRKGDKYLVNKDSTAYGAQLTKGDKLRIVSTRYEDKNLDASLYVNTVGDPERTWVISPRTLLDVCTMVTKDKVARDIQEGDTYIVSTDFDYSGAKVKKGTVLTVRKPSISHDGSFMVGAILPTGNPRPTLWSINKNSILANCILRIEEKEPEVEVKVPVKRLEQKDFLTALESI